MTDQLVFRVEPSDALTGQLRLPGDKSISHRAIMLGALAEGVTDISGFLTGADCLATLQAFRAMGVDIRYDPEQMAERVTVYGVGLHGLQAPTTALEMGNAGTAMRLLTGLMAGQVFDSVLSGDASLNRRPMRRVTEPLQRMGARIDTQSDGTAPLRIHGGQALQSLDYTLPVASAQIKSCLLLAGLYANGRVQVREPAPTRDHSERMLRSFGYAVDSADQVAVLHGGGRLNGIQLTVPGDISSAAFFLVGASMAATEGELVLEGVGVNPTRTGVIDILRLMGADITLYNTRDQGAEPVADIRVRPAALQGIEIPPALVPLAIDEFPAILIAAACAQGDTVLRGAQELRVKESDRIQVMADGLTTLGVNAQPTPDGMIIQGKSIGADRTRPCFSGAEVDSHGDHRIAMAFAMAGLRAEQPILIRDCHNVDTSFPGFADLAAVAGLQITPSELG